MSTPTDSENSTKPQSARFAKFAMFAALCDDLATTASRLERARLIAEYLGGLDPSEVAGAARLLVGRVFPDRVGRKLSVSGRAVMQALETIGATVDQVQWAGVEDFGELVRRILVDRPPPSAELTLEHVRDVFGCIAEAGGSGSRRRRVELLADLFARATPLEAKIIAKVVIGEMRHGVQDGIVLDALARLAGVAATDVRRAHQALGDLGEVALAARTDPSALAGAAVAVFRPIRPMLAQTAADAGEAFALMNGRLALEWKLDGARVQIHKRGAEVRLFSRRMKEITPSLPDVVALVADGARGETMILEGEVVPMEGERPLPFQELMRRFRRIHDVEDAIGKVPVRLYLFDALYLDGVSLLDRPAEERWAALEAARGDLRSVGRVVPADVAEGERFFAAAVAAGYEGAMAKALDSAYTPGVRGRGWLKIKHSVTLDLVIVAADWGYGRRHGWLSNYHLAARDGASGAFVPVGKTFKGPTDAEFRAMTERLLALETAQQGGTVFVRPEVVVEVKFNDIQRSPQYACGMALRFARIVRVRNDKTPAEADTVETMRALHAGPGRGDPSDAAETAR